LRDYRVSVSQPYFKVVLQEPPSVSDFGPWQHATLHKVAHRVLVHLQKRRGLLKRKNHTRQLGVAFTSLSPFSDSSAQTSSCFSVMLLPSGDSSSLPVTALTRASLASTRRLKVPS